MTAVRQQVETVPIGQIKTRINSLNASGFRVDAVTIDRDRDQFWLITSRIPKDSP